MPSACGARRAEVAARQSRAKQLEEIVERTGGLRPRMCGPHSTPGQLDGRQCRRLMRHYPEWFTPAVATGLVASEGRMTIPIDDNTPGAFSISRRDSSSSCPLRNRLPQPTAEAYERRMQRLLHPAHHSVGSVPVQHLRRRSLRRWLSARKTPVLARSSTSGQSFLQLNRREAVGVPSRSRCRDVQTKLGVTDRVHFGALLGRRDAVLRFVRRSRRSLAEHPRAPVDEAEEQLQELNTEYATKRETHRLEPALQWCPRKPGSVGISSVSHRARPSSINIRASSPMSSFKTNVGATRAAAIV